MPSPPAESKVVDGVVVDGAVGRMITVGRRSSP
jgi:hypothetical protein